MTYAESNLTNKENILCLFKMHKIIFTNAVIFLLLWLLMLSSKKPESGNIFLYFFLLSAFFTFVRYKTTEYCITNKRVILKTGFIFRKVKEINFSKIEGVSFKQSVFGRIFNYGKVVITGTGGKKTIFKKIVNPVEFKNHINLGEQNENQS